MFSRRYRISWFTSDLHQAGGKRRRWDIAAAPAQAQTATNAGAGFQLNRYEPTAAGEWSFWVDHPWYSSTRYFAAGVTLNYAHNPLVFGTINTDGTFSQRQSVIAHQLIGHVDLAGSFLDRVMLTLSLPVVLLDKGGTPAAGVAASDQVSVGDLRFGLMVRLFGQPYRSPISLSIGGEVWLPWRQFFPDSIPSTSSDSVVRGIPKLALGGLASKVMWSLTAGVLLRAHSNLGDPALGAEANSELQLGAAIAYANTNIRLAIGPEVVASTAILGDNAFKVPTTNVEALAAQPVAGEARLVGNPLLVHRLVDAGVDALQLIWPAGIVQSELAVKPGDNIEFFEGV